MPKSANVDGQVDTRKRLGGGWPPGRSGDDRRREQDEPEADADVADRAPRVRRANEVQPARDGEADRAQRDRERQQRVAQVREVGVQRGELVAVALLVA